MAAKQILISPHCSCDHACRTFPTWKSPGLASFSQPVSMFNMIDDDHASANKQTHAIAPTTSCTAHKRMQTAQVLKLWCIDDERVRWRPSAGWLERRLHGRKYNCFSGRPSQRSRVGVFTGLTWLSPDPPRLPARSYSVILTDRLSRAADGHCLARRCMPTSCAATPMLHM